MLRLRTALAALLVTGGGSGAAVATEGIRFAAPAGTYDWSGMYVGGHLGWGWSGIDTEIVSPGILVGVLDFLGAQTSASPDVDGFLAGGHIGFQHQFDRWVLGIEASLSGGLDGSSKENFADSINLGFGSLELRRQSGFDTKIDQLFTLTGRVGYAWDRWLGYFKGGYASAQIGVDYGMTGSVAFCPPCSPALVDGGVSAASRERHHGWTLGGGVEYAFMPNVILGLEYNYIDLGAETHNARSNAFLNILGTPLGSIDFDSRLRVDPDAIHTVYARVSFKFGGDTREPVSLK